MADYIKKITFLFMEYYLNISFDDFNRWVVWRHLLFAS